MESTGSLTLVYAAGRYLRVFVAPYFNIADDARRYFHPDKHAFSIYEMTLSG